MKIDKETIKVLIEEHEESSVATLEIFKMAEAYLYQADQISELKSKLHLHIGYVGRLEDRLKTAHSKIEELESELGNLKLELNHEGFQERMKTYYEEYDKAIEPAMAMLRLAREKAAEGPIFYAGKEVQPLPDIPQFPTTHVVDGIPVVGSKWSLKGADMLLWIPENWKLNDWLFHNFTPITEPVVTQQYRDLEIGEHTQAGDEFEESPRNWKPAMYRGIVYESSPNYRRPIVEKQYRMLGEGDLLQSGDELEVNAGCWEPTGDAGRILSGNDFNYRRPI